MRVTWIINYYYSYAVIFSCDIMLPLRPSLSYSASSDKTKHGIYVSVLSDRRHFSRLCCRLFVLTHEFSFVVGQELIRKYGVTAKEHVDVYFKENYYMLLLLILRQLA